MKKKIPNFKSDKEAEDFVENANLSEYDLSDMRPVNFEFEKKEARLNMRIPTGMLSELKERAEIRGIPYQRYIREVLQNSLMS